MKKKILNVVLALTLVMGFNNTAIISNAAEDSLSYSWDVTYNGKNFASTYDSSKAAIQNVMPGDTITYTVNYINGTNEATDFYMNADVIKTLEDTSAAEGGAYSFKITNNGETIFDSETVGGDAEEVVGLKQVKGKEGAYFSLGSVPAKTSNKGTVQILITLDGNSQTNNYMAAVANLQVKFGAEDSESAKRSKTNVKKVTKVNTITKNVPVTTKKSIVKQVIKTLDNGTDIVAIDDEDVPLSVGGDPKTGDSVFPVALCIGMLMSGLCLIGWYVVMTVNNKKSSEEM